MTIPLSTQKKARTSNSLLDVRVILFLCFGNGEEFRDAVPVDLRQVEPHVIYPGFPYEKDPVIFLLLLGIAIGDRHAHVFCRRRAS